MESHWSFKQNDEYRCLCICQVESFELSVSPRSHCESVHKDECCLSSNVISGMYTPNQHSAFWSSCLPPICARDHDNCSSLVGVVEAGVWAGSWDSDYNLEGSLWKEHWIWTSREETCGGIAKKTGREASKYEQLRNVLDSPRVQEAESYK